MVESKIPKCCENDNCENEFKVGDKIIQHNDLFSSWYFCCDNCYVQWLDEFGVKKEIVVGEEEEDEIF